MPNKKRYLVTHADTNLSVSPVAEILGITADNIRHGVSFLATDAQPGEKDVLEFSNLGITSVSLDAKDVSKLKESSNIMAVEEDVEMRILEAPAASVEEEQRTETNGNYQNDAYQRGYQEGIQQIMESMNQFHSPSDGYNAMQPSLFSNPQLSSFFRQAPQPLPLATQPIPWNINLVKAPGAWARGINGAGIRVAVIDTGISNHPDLLPIAGGVSLVPGVISFNDDNSHGSHCAGIIGARNNGFGVVGVAHSCKLYAVKVLNAAGSGMSSWIIAGMDWAAAHGMHVASMSLGGLSGPIVAYAQAIKRLQDRGTVVCIAAGNSFSTNFPWVNAPGNSIIPGVPNASPIAVGAIDSHLIIAPFSSRGGQNPVWNQVEVVAPGVNINSSVLGGAYGLKSGTSMATPHVAGAAALIKQRFPGISPAAVKLKLMSTARDLGAGGYDKTYGAGLINCNSATL